MQLGIHASIRHGFLNAFTEVAQLNCKTLQIFPRRPRHKVKIFSEAELKELKEFRTRHSISPLVIHALYQPNIASSNPEILKKSRESLLQEFRLAVQLDAEFFIVHAGSYSPDSGLKTGIQICAQTIRNLLETIHARTKVLIENVPGGGRRMGGTFQELRQLLGEVGWQDRTGICFDTAHAWACGYPIQTIAGLEDTLSCLEQELGLDSLQLFHINDTSAQLNSHRDIHQHIGEGFIGAEPLRYLVQTTQFKNKSGILETPKDLPSSDQKNLLQLIH